MSNFKFDIGQNVSLNMSDERGRVVGRAEYESSQNAYYVRYVRADGCQIEDWVVEDALETAE